MSDKNPETKILKLIEESPDGLQTEEIASALDLTRHTISKYLEVLRAKDNVHYRKAGRTKIWKMASSDIRIRYIVKDDVNSIIRIVLAINSTTKKDKQKKSISYLRETMDKYVERNEPLMNLAAEIDNNLVGFIIGEIKAWEFGQSQKTGWINALGVDPEHQGKGAGRKLGEALISNFRSLGITRVRTLVNWYEGDLLLYFRNLGFNILNMTPLEVKIQGKLPLRVVTKRRAEPFF